MPLWLSRSISPEIGFVVEEREDRADAELQDWDEKHNGKKKKKGVSRFIVPMDADGEPLDYGGVLREQLLKEVAEASKDEESDDSSTGELDEEGMPIQRAKPKGGYDPAEYGDGLVESS